MKIVRTAWEDIKGVFRLRWKLWREMLAPEARRRGRPAGGAISPSATPAGAGGPADSPMPSLFLTGATGFIGQALVRRLSGRYQARVRCLTRHAGATLPPGWEAVTGDLLAPESWAGSLEGSEVVLHAGAATGSAGADEMLRVNAHATRALVRQAERAGVRRFILVSSIAARYPDLSDYPYGRSKVLAEEAVRTAAIPFTIVRPTIVLGPTSPIWQRLRQLASGPVALLPGDGTARVQPIDVEDVALALATLIRRDTDEELIELGGPDVVTFDTLMRGVRLAVRGRSGPLLRIPLPPLRAALRLAARLAGSRLPIGPGQLVPFAENGTALPSRLLTELLPGFSRLDDLLGRLARSY